VLFSFDPDNIYLRFQRMKTEEILEQIKLNNKIDEVWLAISLAKLNSIIHAKVGTNLLEQEGLHPTLVRQLLEMSLKEISEAMIQRLKSRN
jgi:hypothetical protein